MGRERKEMESPTGRPYAKKSLGQNFLIDEGVIRRISAALSLTEEEPVLEIGPGRGALTRALLATGAQVTAVELDDYLSGKLSNELEGVSRFEIIHADFLALDLPTTIGRIAKGKRVKIAANLPYYISTPILKKLFDHRALLSDTVVMLQKEVADRVTASVGTSERGYLTVMLERGFACEKLFDVPPGAFRPVPKVMSSVVRLSPKAAAKGAVSDDDFELLVSAGFRQKRKTLKNNLVSSGIQNQGSIEIQTDIEGILARADIPPLSRAEALSDMQWETLASLIFGNSEETP